MAGLVPDAQLAPANLRISEPSPDHVVLGAGDDIVVEIDENGEDVPEFDMSGAVVQIRHGDGSVSISLDGKPLLDAQNEPKDEGWFANLADGDIGEDELNRISEDLLRGIDADNESRREWLESVVVGIRLLGLKTETPGGQGASVDGAPVEGMSKVRHPLLLEAVLRFQANARSELLPTDGPVKIRDDQNPSPTPTPAQMGHNGGPPLDETTVADALEQDLNHYFTAIATEYYPDTDRMLLKFGLAGTSFKKVYFCPLRMRPVSETVDANDLIVSNEATDLGNARRVTHKVMLKPSVVKRLQILGVYRDVPLDMANTQKLDPVQVAEKDQQGVQADPVHPEDRDREIYECYGELDIKGHEHKWKGKESGLELPYRVTIDVTSRKVLAVVRNYNKTNKTLPQARKTFVKYTFVPGLGFYDIGLLDILGNTTTAVTAAWRLMLDNGMFANFPGWLQADFSARQKTNVIRVAPGSGATVQTNGMPIGDAIMPLPYETAHMPALMSLTENMVETGQRVGGTAELQVGEGNQQAPVGTTLAMIEQATKVMNSVHKRMCASQGEEFKLLVDCFREHPESFLEQDMPSNMAWTRETFMQALDDHDLVPQADPNTASHVQRMLKGMGLKQLQAASPGLYDPIKIDTFIVQNVLQFSNPTQFFVPPGAMQQPPPELIEAQAKAAKDNASAQADTVKAAASMLTAKTKAAEVQHTLGTAAAGAQPDPIEEMKAHATLMDAETKKQGLHIEAQKINADSHNQVLDRQAEHHSDLIDLAKEVIGHAHDAEMAAREVPKVEGEIEKKPAP